ncbi:Hypothetical predicted protein [Octopus vulgaris]|uniref:Uncharacterized protein n=1 Tax=Octopus vulgaris TaxID=6645 RepID=A0AA36B696_OCTVU|nr:Hypothetical predicted protein [Octopus vulgaris]
MLRLKISQESIIYYKYSINKATGSMPIFVLSLDLMKREIDIQEVLLIVCTKNSPLIIGKCYIVSCLTLEENRVELDIFHKVWRSEYQMIFAKRNF